MVNRRGIICNRCRVCCRICNEQRATNTSNRARCRISDIYIYGRSARVVLSHTATDPRVSLYISRRVIRYHNRNQYQQPQPIRACRCISHVVVYLTSLYISRRCISPYGNQYRNRCRVYRCGCVVIAYVYGCCRRGCVLCVVMYIYVAVVYVLE